MSIRTVTKNLRKSYGALTADERIKAIHEACCRGDDDELRVLINNAPKVGFLVKHHYGLAEALRDVEDSVLVGAFSTGMQIMFLSLRFVETNDEATVLDALLVSKCVEYQSTVRAWDAIVKEFGVEELLSLPMMRANEPLLDLCFAQIERVVETISPSDSGEVQEAADVLADYFRQSIATLRQRWEL